MPIYEYQCSICGHQLEVLQSMSDKPLTECPNCHKPGLNKLISPSGFQLKGTGWYKTDYSSKGKAKSTEEGGSGVKDSESPQKTTETKKEDTSTSTESKGKTSSKETKGETKSADGTKSS
jgi:putative FmdB family regulatory protein